MTLISPDLREAVVLRAGSRCEYCQLSQESQVATFPVDHILPVALNGKTVIDNLALSCPRCNANKWMHVTWPDPVSGEVVPLFDPRTQAWADHFRWSKTNPVILEPLTPTGRATDSLLDLNDSQHLMIRRLLGELGMHPPV